MEYCCHVWGSAPSCYFDMLYDRRVFRANGSTPVASLELLGHLRNVASLGLLYWYYFKRCELQSFS